MQLRNPALRWGIGLSSGTVLAAVALLFLEGTLQLLVLGIAVLDAVFVQWFLGQAAEN
ncbi:MULTISPECIES: hypothetical protein [Halorussus]|uniref:hypothetical protein n=1 Tax=Halorussus TaxID=1070314 RepID=UPI0020A1A5E6|nr:hypothetical protein [Halorussus vallis]USZ76884.1 hypothetical protein NGM07_06030 [Halorussus vallis]